MKMFRSGLPIAFLSALLLSGAEARTRAAPTAQADLLIRGGTVVDGTGGPPRNADVLVKSGKIVAVGPNITAGAKEVLDAKGLVVAPGFIDPHNHSDVDMADREGRFNRSFVSQGVTTIIGGPDGGYSPAEIAKCLDAYRSHGIATNVAFYVGHGGIRSEVMGEQQNRAPTGVELQKMKSLARQGMEMGAVGLTSGLMYSPGLFSATDEVAQLASAVAPFGGMYATHVRDPHRELLESNWEAIEIGRRGGVPVLLTHATTPGKNHRGLMRGVVDMIEDSNRRGIKVVTDQYPYNAVATIQLWGVLKYPESVKPTPQAIRAALRDPELSRQIREESVTGGRDGFSQFKASGPDSLLILSCPGCERYENKFIADIAREKNVDGYQAIVDLLLNAPTDHIVASLGGFYEEDMQYMLRQPWTMISSDGFGDIAAQPSDDPFRSPHPRSKGAFPRILGRYVRDLHLLTLPEAIRKMTSATADFFGLKGRGRIAPGAVADITIFDPRRIADRSTWKDPNLMAVGIEDVLVNGRFVMKAGKFLDSTPGAFVQKGKENVTPLRGS